MTKKRIKQEKCLALLEDIDNRLRYPYDNMWDSQSRDGKFLWSKLSAESRDNVNAELLAAGLPRLQLILNESIPTDAYWLEGMGPQEKNLWLERAECLRTLHACYEIYEKPVTAYDLWKADGGKYALFLSACDLQKGKIAQYLSDNGIQRSECTKRGYGHDT